MNAILPTHPLNLLHPRTGEPLRALGFTKRGAPIWPVIGGSEPAGEVAKVDESAKGSVTPADVVKTLRQAEAVASKAEEGPHGYPENTPVAEMTDKQASAYWKQKARANEQGQRTLRAELDAAKPKIEGYDALEAASKTEQERAVENARTEAANAARAEERSKASLALVGAEFRAAAARTSLTDEQVDGFLEDLDRSKFLAADGTPDLDRIKGRVGLWAPKVEPRTPDLGQGRERGGGKASGVASGADLYEQKHGRKPAAAKS